MRLDAEDLKEVIRQLEANKPVTISISLGMVFALVSQLETANQVPDNPVGETEPAKRLLAHLRATLPSELLVLVDRAAAETHAELQKPIQERVFAAALAAGEYSN